MFRREVINWFLGQDSFFGDQENFFEETIIPETHDPQEESDDDLGDFDDSGIGSRLLQ